MCIYENYNKVLTSNNHDKIRKFIDLNCKVDGQEYSCPKLGGGCDYLGWLDDKLYDLEIKKDLGLEIYCISNLKILEDEPDEVLKTIKEKIDATVLHFSLELKDISIDCKEQLDEFLLTINDNKKFMIEVVGRNSAIENERSFDTLDNKIEDYTTKYQIGAYTKLLGDNDYWFKLL